MFKNEQGSVVVLAMVVITVLLVLATGFMKAMYNEIKITSSHTDLVQAGYLAEAGIEKALNVIKNDPDHFSDLSDENDKQTLFGGKYWYNNPTNNNPNGDIYTVKVIAKLNGARKQIKAKILNNIFDKTVAAGGDIKTGGKQQINGNTSSGNKTKIANFDFQYYKDVAQDNDRYFNTGSYNLPDNPSGGITYVDPGDNLTVDVNNRDVSGPSKNNPAVIVVEGDLTIKGSKATLENIYFIVKNEFATHHNNNKSSFINTFIYAGEGIDFNGNSLQQFSGSLMTPGDINLKDVKGQGGTFDYSTIQTDVLSVSSIKIIYWQEINN